jgi:Mg2+-importing ATPase
VHDGAHAQGSSGGRAGAFWATDLAEVRRRADARDGGLSDEEAAQRLARDGPNRVEAARGHRGLRLLLAQFTSPIILLLSAATVLSMVLGDVADGVIILAILAGALRRARGRRAVGPGPGQGRGMSWRS